MDTMYFDSIPSPVEIAQDLQMPQFSLDDFKVIDCSMNYTSGLNLPISLSVSVICSVSDVDLLIYQQKVK